ncbi:hypothetical protein [Thalassotalea mangrovi]|uniref:NirD/YgiW/YdeI family stress tolerance protein n=1 Tax=Thalassotalea mangrovi TaxID=2572245 RepID=A0A4U1B624_9GAMM|nr:hypothetical protein [Thalassotalea mangrovi]TKB45783.1 hypothetical protein E8M12_06960 [Thalassotalea mangrovi]
MKIAILIFSLIFSSTLAANQQDLAKAANNNPFLNGSFNPAYIGQLTGIAGEVVDILNTTDNRLLYKLNLNIDGINPVWVASIAAIPGDPLALGDGIIFKGYISSASELSPEIVKRIKVETVMLALVAERP